MRVFSLKIGFIAELTDNLRGDGRGAIRVQKIR